MTYEWKTHKRHRSRVKQTLYKNIVQCISEIKLYRSLEIQSSITGNPVNEESMTNPTR